MKNLYPQKNSLYKIDKLYFIYFILNSMNAWVWCVFGGKRYLSGLFPSVYSLIGKSKYHRVLLYTRDVITNDKDEVDQCLLKTFTLFFDKIVEVEYITFHSKDMKTKKQNDIYKSWIDKSYTKWNLLNLTDYNKVMFIDSDVIFLENIDTLFDLPCPSGTFSSPWGNRFVKDGGINLDMYPVNHGEKISHKTITKTVKYGKNTVAVIGTMVLLKPDKTHFQQLIDYIQTNIPYGYKGCNSGFDEQSITLFYSSVLNMDWYFIHQRYNYIPWKTNWLSKEDVPCVYHYFNKQKPWEMNEEEYPDLKSFYDVCREMKNKYPEISYIKIQHNKV